MVTFNSDKIFPYNKLLFENSMTIFFRWVTHKNPLALNRVFVTQLSMLQINVTHTSD